MLYMREVDGKLIACCPHCHTPLERIPPWPDRTNLVQIGCSTCQSYWHAERILLLSVEWEGEQKLDEGLNGPIPQFL
jgi:hypothetical protein